MSQPSKPRNVASRDAQLRDFPMPAMPPLALFTAIERGIRALVRRHRLSRQLRCDAHLLQDIGQSDDALREAMKLRVGAGDEASGRH